MDEVIIKFEQTLLNGDKTKEEYDQDVDSILKERQKGKRTGALVFCVSCGAKNRTLRKWHNSYLCTDCYRIAQNVGDEKFIKALKGEE